YFYFKDKSCNETDYFLGGRKMGPWVTALSAQASDMSGWLLMGFPGSILAFGFGKVWIGIGLAIGTYLNWRFTAERLRKFSKAAGDSITIPQYLSNRFAAKSPGLRIVCAIVFLVCFTIYVASGFKAGGTLFQEVLGINGNLAMVIFAVILILYTFTGGFKAVCWTDFFQALMMVVALILVPIVILGVRKVSLSEITLTAPNYFNLLPSGKADWESASSIISGLAWGLGYFGMPHIIVRFMSIEKSSMIKKSRRIATVWVVISLAMAVLIAVCGRVVFPELIDAGKETVFIKLVRDIFPTFIAGILLSAILAAAMSTADSQLLVASSCITSDLYKPMAKSNVSDQKLLRLGRLIVIIIAIAAFIIARNPNSGGIMDLVENAWAGFGAAFGPVIIFSLYWKKFTYKGAIAGIIAGGATVFIWRGFFAGPTGVYELFPGFIAGVLGCVIATKVGKPVSPEAEKIFETATDPSYDE
ncbi:MAG: sodium/proline symporter PutP, partial [Firmicutes bacterium]|nr:sodium/proline symporter PutP [Bacillota bacterium]